jgi:Laminin G domain.
MRFSIALCILLVSVSAAGQLPAGSCCTTPPAKLTAWWTFDAAGSPSHDIALADNAAVHSGGPTATAGVVGQAICFNGAGAQAVTANHPDLDFIGACPASEELVIDFYIKTTQAQGLMTVLDKRDNPASPRGWSVYVYNGRPGLDIATGVGAGFCGAATSTTSACTNETAPVSIADGKWHFVAIRIAPRCGQGARGTFFVDGNVVYTFVPRQGNMSNTGPLYIAGHNPAFGPNFFNGCLDELEIVKRAMSDAEIFAIYNAGSKGKCKTLPQPLPCVLDPGMVAAGNTFARRPNALAQTFTPTQSGSLTQITHGLQSISTITSYNLLITTTTNGIPAWNGGPYVGPNVLYSATNQTVFSTNAMVNGVVTITAGPSLTAGTLYALVIVPGNPTNGVMAWRGNSSASSYPAGSAYELNGTVWSVPTVGPKDHGFILNGKCP